MDVRSLLLLLFFPLLAGPGNAALAGEAASPATPPPQAASRPQPEPAASLLPGQWQGRNGELLAMDRNGYQYFEGGERLDAGTYVTAGDTLTTLSTTGGGTEHYRFEVDGQTLTLEDPWGVSVTLTRVRMNQADPQE